MVVVGTDPFQFPYYTHTAALTSIGVEITRSSQPPPLYARVPLPFDFTLFAPGIEAVP